MKRLLLIPFLILVSLTTQAQRQGVKIDSCSFKESCALVRNLSDTGLWQIGAASKVFFAQGGIGSSGLLTDSAKGYLPNKDEYVDVRFENFDLNIRLAFWHRFDTDTLADGGYIEVSYDQGITWQDIHQNDSNHQPIYMNVYGMYPESAALGNGKRGFSGRSADTVLSIIEWVWNIPLKTEPDSIWLRFHFYSDSLDNNKEGWMIDRMETSFDEVWGFDDLTNPHRIKAYPNPGKGFYTLEYLTESLTNYELFVYDFQGKRVLNQTLNGQKYSELDLSEYPSGMYFYTLMEKGSVVYAGKLVKE